MTTMTDERLTALIAALDTSSLAKTVHQYDPTANPVGEATLDDLVHGMGVDTSQDHMPAINMAAKAPDSTLAYEMEAARFKGRQEGRDATATRRKAEARARAARKYEFDELSEVDEDYVETLDPERLMQAWLVVVSMYDIVIKMAATKQRWANRLLGAAAEDIPSVAVEAMAKALTRSDKDLSVLRVAAEELMNSERGIPRDQKVDENDPAERKAIKKARKWLMGMANNRVNGALVETYTKQRNLRSDNLDAVASVIASISGVGEDPMVNRHKADRAPSFLGTRFQRPDGIDGNLLAMALTAAITDRGLDPLVEFLLDDENRRVDGFVKWSECAERIFLLTPGGVGEFLWQGVQACTDDHEQGRRRRGVAAREHVRLLFDFMPSLVMSVVDAFDPHTVGRSSTNHYRAVLASDFQAYLPEPGPVRTPLVPALRWATSRDAAAALTEYLAQLTTGSDFVESIVFA